VPDVPVTTRIKAATLAALVALVCAACGSTTTESAGPIVPVSVDCGMQIPRLGGTNRLFAEIPGFTISEICPADADPSFATSEFDSLATGLVSQNGNPILRVLAGRLKSGSGDAFMRTYLGNLSAHTRDGVGVPSETEELGGHVVSHFNIPLVSDGYLYADGRTVVITYVAAGAPPATVEDALTEILDDLR
jgi:hypothetical protein